jgi:hypothetical protein
VCHRLAGLRTHRLGADAHPAHSPRQTVGTQAPKPTPVLHRRPTRPILTQHRAAPVRSRTLDRSAPAGPEHPARPDRTRLSTGQSTPNDCQPARGTGARSTSADLPYPATEITRYEVDTNRARSPWADPRRYRLVAPTTFAPRTRALPPALQRTPPSPCATLAPTRSASIAEPQQPPDDQETQRPDHHNPDLPRSDLLLTARP